MMFGRCLHPDYRPPSPPNPGQKRYVDSRFTFQNFSQRCAMGTRSNSCDRQKIEAKSNSSIPPREVALLSRKPLRMLTVCNYWKKRIENVSQGPITFRFATTSRPPPPSAQRYCPFQDRKATCVESRNTNVKVSHCCSHGRYASTPLPPPP